MKNKYIFLLGGWATATIGLFLATVAGTIAEEQFLITRNTRLIIQAAVMSIIVVPIILRLYVKFHKETRQTQNPAYSIKRSHHFFTGFLFVMSLAFAGLFMANAFGWLEIEQWHNPSSWLSAFLINMLIAFFYEALPEELALRGLIFDTLRERFATWISVIMQTLIFLAFSLGVNILQTLVGMGSLNITIISNLVLFFIFGIALALIRVFTGSLWASIGFHLGYLEMTRFLVMPTEYGAQPVVSFQENIPYGGNMFFIIGVMLFGAIFILLLLLSIRRWVVKR
ncbi:CPBP family intramembrane glutamic endopeptidase [Oceanobacillus jeddahense]|uniref:CPBP family intramembrane glutamic endopeptidase n=1 Tax=Oceanobacillus jeddahense TaxID=1462527 RepID=UPI000595DA8C|nr:CPBP family intramembrane glutamic endopeptidase [Oceanobacillus jeddahense]